jgi:hypothetical protein
VLDSPPFPILPNRFSRNIRQNAHGEAFATDDKLQLGLRIADRTGAHALHAASVGSHFKTRLLTREPRREATRNCPAEVFETISNRAELFVSSRGGIEKI